MGSFKPNCILDWIYGLFAYNILLPYTVSGLFIYRISCCHIPYPAFSLTGYHVVIYRIRPIHLLDILLSYTESGGLFAYRISCCHIPYPAYSLTGYPLVIYHIRPICLPDILLIYTVSGLFANRISFLPYTVSIKSGLSGAFLSNDLCHLKIFLRYN